MSYRSGDWICAVPNCAAHNFGRNEACIGCGTSRLMFPVPVHPSLNIHRRAASVSALCHSPSSPISPRFALYGGVRGQMIHPHQRDLPLPPHPHPHPNTLPVQSSHSPYIPSPSPFQQHHLQPQPQPQPQPQQFHKYSLQLQTQMAPTSRPQPQQLQQQQQQSLPPRPAGSSYPLLTPSGRALSIGGRVQNISLDPMSPCIMYWPDNEPFPAPGQIRPIESTVSYPPIINTGNKGAAEKQPGDWMCSKCNYLNWRRRKVCQTCFPYAEGNGDSISAAVQVERIALLTNILTNERSLQSSLQAAAAARTASSSSSPATLVAGSAGQSRLPVHAQQHHARSAVERPHAQAQTTGGYEGMAIYQTSGPGHVPPSHAYDASIVASSERSGHGRVPTSNGRPGDLLAGAMSMLALDDAPSCNLLPSFLHDIIESPSLSPTTSSSSADFSFSWEEHGEHSSTGAGAGAVSQQHPAVLLNLGGQGGGAVAGGNRDVQSQGQQQSQQSQRKMPNSGSSSGFALARNSIWKMDGLESKLMSATNTTAAAVSSHAS